MSDVELNKRIVREQHHQVWSRSNPEAVDRFYAHDAKCHFPGRTVVGRIDIKAFVVNRCDAFLDWNERVELIIGEREMVATRVASTALHIGRFPSAEGTGRRIRLSETFLFQLRDGLIVECWAESTCTDSFG